MKIELDGVWLDIDNESETLREAAEGATSAQVLVERLVEMIQCLEIANDLLKAESLKRLDGKLAAEESERAFREKIPLSVKLLYDPRGTLSPPQGQGLGHLRGRSGLKFLAVFADKRSTPNGRNEYV